jgi:hypothetical protein
MTAGACFGCGPGYEGLVAELAGLVNGTWVLTPGVHDVMIMANGATVPSELPGEPSQQALAWWHSSVTAMLAPTPRSRMPKQRPQRREERPTRPPIDNRGLSLDEGNDFA